MSHKGPTQCCVTVGRVHSLGKIFCKYKLFDFKYKIIIIIGVLFFSGLISAGLYAALREAI